MNDDDDKPTGKRRAPSAWGDDQRAVVGRDHRGGESARHSRPNMTDSERQRHLRAMIPDHVEREFGGPGEIEPEITRPWAMLDRENLKPDEQEIVYRSKRDSGSPVVFEDIAKVSALLFRHIKTLHDDRSARKEQADAILELIKHPPNEAVIELQQAVETIRIQLGTPHSENKGTVQENIARGRTVYGIATKLAGFALAVALASVSFVIASIRESGADDVLKAQARHDIDALRVQFAKDVEDQKQENRDLRRLIERLKDKNQ